MADKETGLNITVSAVADKNSAKEAVNELTKDVLSSLKDGYIEIPAELKVPIKGASKDLEKAQKDVIKQWERTFKEGFSSSAKDLDALTEAYQRFKKLAGQQHKAGTKQSKGISAIMGDQIQAYAMSKKDVQARRAEFKKQIEKAQKRNAKQGMTSDEKKLLKEEIDHAIAQEYKRKGYGKLSKDLGRGASRAKAATPGSPINLGLRSPAMGGPYVSERTLRMSELSPYRNIDEVRRAKEQQEIRKAERASLTSRKATTEEIESSKQRVKQREAAGRSQSGTEYELIKKALLTELAKIQGGLIKGKPDATSQKLIDQVLANLTYDEQQGVDPLKSVMGIHNMLQKRYDTKGKIGVTDGGTKGEGPNQKEANDTLKQIYKILGQFIDARQSVIDNVRIIKDSLSSRTSSRNSLYSQELSRITNSDQMQAMKESLRPLESGMTNINRSVKIGNTKEAVEFDQSEKINKENKDINRDTAKTVKKDVATGFNTDAKADALIQLVSSILQQIQKGIPVTDDKKTSNKQTEDKQEIINDKTLLTQSQKTKSYSMEMANVYDEIERAFSPMKKALIPLQNSARASVETPKAVSKSEFNKIVPELIKEEYKNQVQKSTIYASPLRQGIVAKFESVFDDLIGATKRYEKVLKANADEQDAMAAERIKTYGLNNGRNPNDTGDIAGMRRILQLYRTNKDSIEQNPELAQRIRLTPSREIDTTEITKALNEALSGKNMRNAQMGGSIPRQILGGMTAFIGMPSLEKSRAQADGLNQILGNINNALQSVLINIQTKETELAGMEASGQAKFNKEGYLTADSTSAAFKTLADLEEEKLVLDSIKADLLANDKIIDQTGGKFSKLVKNLSFTSPVLKENNGILRNINSGLDKNGKALKFQTRMAEILNYTFQLMSRSIGQMFKNWLSMLNPLNIIKRLFEDYASYDPKWQRTMNVIKNNFREIILPFMQKIAQTIVNIIGFLDIILQKVQAAFGYTPISLFDQKNANEFKKTYEEIQNITAGFDELHDIGSSSENDPDNLLGDIYKPELSQEWIDLANKIGDLFADVIKGDLGFGEAMLRILEILGQTLALIAKKIWDWFKQTAIGKWITEHWKELLAGLLAIFLAWKGLKIFGPMLLKALFGGFTSGAIGNIFSKVGGWITSALNMTSFGKGILQGFTDVISGKGGLIKSLKFAFTNPHLISQMGGWGQMLGMIFVQALGAILGGTIAVKGISKGFDMVADTTSYNIGLMEAGGNEEDKKSDLGGKIFGTATGAIGGGIFAAFLGLSGPVGAAIGGIVGLITTSLAPAIEEITVKSKEMNNELLKIEQYQGALQGATTQVKAATEAQDLMSQALEGQTNKIYEQGEQLGISKTRLDQLIASVQNGTYNNDMLYNSELNLASSLEQLSALQDKNRDATNKLTEAQRLQQVAITNLAIAEDIASGNYEVAAARIEAAFATSVYTTEEAGKQMAMLLKQTNGEMKANLLENMSPDMRKNFAEYVNISDTGKKDLVKIYEKLNDEQKGVFEQNYGDLFSKSIQDTLDEGQKVIDNTELDWSHPFQSIGKVLGSIWNMIFGGGSTNSNSGNNTRSIETASFAVGTNYVPNDGFAYLHQGEAVIPKKYNQPYQQQNAIDASYMDQMIATMRSLDSTIQQGITVKGEFKQRGSDLVATVEKAKNRNGNQPLNNAIFAR